jgi:hypothetical protein
MFMRSHLRQVPVFIMAKHRLPRGTRSLLQHGISGQLVALLGQQQQLLQRIRALLPPNLAAHVVHARQSPGRILLYCDSSVVASTLRFRLPQLLPDSSRVDTKVLPPTQQRRRIPSAPRSPNNGGAALRQSLPAVSDPDLRQALGRIAAALDRASRSER